MKTYRRPDDVADVFLLGCGRVKGRGRGALRPCARLYVATRAGAEREEEEHEEHSRAREAGGCNHGGSHFPRVELLSRS
jgi:hypothetical protein